MRNSYWHRLLVWMSFTLRCWKLWTLLGTSVTLVSLSRGGLGQNSDWKTDWEASVRLLKGHIQSSWNQRENRKSNRFSVLDLFWFGFSWMEGWSWWSQSGSRSHLFEPEHNHFKVQGSSPAKTCRVGFLGVLMFQSQNLGCQFLPKMIRKCLQNGN